MIPDSDGREADRQKSDRQKSDRQECGQQEGDQQEDSGQERARPPHRRARLGPVYQRLYLGQVVSVLGARVTTVCLPLLALGTDGAGAAGLVVFLLTVPSVALAVPAGALVSRVRPRRVLLVCASGRGALHALGALLLLTDRLALAPLCVFALAEGMLQTPFDLCERTLIGRVVPAELRVPALSRIQIRTFACAVAGPALGGVLFTLAASLPLAVTALAHLVSVLLLVPLRSLPHTEDTEVPGRGPLAGVRLLFGDRVLRGCTYLVAAGAFALQALVLISLTRAHAEGGGGSAGTVISCFAAGGVAGALLAPRLTRAWGRASLMLVACAAWTATLLILALLPPLPVWCAVLALCAATMPMWNVLVQVYFYEVVAEDMLARTLAAGSMVSGGAAALGALAGGSTLETLGPGRTLFLLAVLTVLPVPSAVRAFAAPPADAADAPSR